MGFDEILPVIGCCGRYQFILYICLNFVIIICGLHSFSNVIYQAKPKFRCRLPNENASSAYALSEETLKKNYPRDPGSKTYSECYMYSGNETKVSCSEYVFDDSIYKKTTIVEWNMVCSRSLMASGSDSCFMVGIMIGSIVFGLLSDRFGRKIVLCSTIIAQFALSIIITLNPYYIVYAITRLLIGATVLGAILAAYVLGTEMVGPRDRIYISVMLHCFFSVGYMLAALYAYYLRHWRYLFGAITAPGILFFGYWFLVLESPRWLLTNKKTNKAEKLIKKIAKVNRKELDQKQLSDVLGEPQSDSETRETDDTITKKVTVLDIFRYPKLRRRSMIIFMDWFALALSYYGLSWNSSNLGGDDFLNLFLAGAVELPAYLMLTFTLNRWGRKLLLSGSMIIAGIFLIAIAGVPEDMIWLIITLAMVGKFAITAGFSVIYIFTVEQYPTVIRTSGLGVASTVARVGSILAPFINSTNEYWKPTPNLIYGVLVLIGAVLSLTLPETLNKKLPETIEEGENF